MKLINIILMELLFFSFIVSAIPASEYSDVLLVTNNASSMSINISNAFIQTRNITYRVNISVTTSEWINFATFNSSIRQPIENYIIANGLQNKINYIVLTKDIPLKIYYEVGGCAADKSVDSSLTLILTPSNGSICSSGSTTNPMYGKTVHANKTYYNMYMVTRLDGYTYTDVVRLFNTTNNSVVQNGQCVLDRSMTTSDGYDDWDAELYTASQVLTSKSINHTYNATTTFITNKNNISCYYSWGSNDGHITANSSQWNLSFVYGSIADTAVSTSARSFAIGTTYGQSLIADLIAMNVTAVKGYAIEPYLSAVSHPAIVVDRYYSNYTTIEALYMGSARINWRDVYIGDPKVKIIVASSNPVTNESNVTQPPNSTCATEYASDYPTQCDYQRCYFLYSDCVREYTFTQPYRTCTSNECYGNNVTSDLTLLLYLPFRVGYSNNTYTKDFSYYNRNSTLNLMNYTDGMYNFNATQYQNIQVTPNPLNGTHTEKTISFWFYTKSCAPPSVSVVGLVSDRTTMTSTHTQIDFRSDCRIKAFYNNGTTESNTSWSTSVIPLNTWTHVTVIYNQNVSVYLNGVYNIGASSIPPYYYTANNYPLFIGTYYNQVGDRTVNGSIAFVKVYNRTLTQAEILDDYLSSNIKFRNTSIDYTPYYTCLSGGCYLNPYSDNSLLLLLFPLYDLDNNLLTSDYSKYNNNFTKFGTPSYSEGEMFLDGNGDYLRAPQINITGDWTLCGKMRTETKTNSQYNVAGVLASNGATSSGIYGIRVFFQNQSADKVQVRAVIANETTALNLNYLYNYTTPTDYIHICANQNSTHFMLYVDGIMRNNATATYGRLKLNNSYFEIGTYGSATAYSLNGSIINVKFYNRSLSDSEILNDYNLGR